MGALYAIDFPNGKRYIGITSKDTAQARFQQHVANLHRPTPRRGALYAALQKYGSAAVIVRTLAADIDDWELLCLAEQEAIEKFNSMAPHGYNLTTGGEGVRGAVWSEESRDRFSEVKRKLMRTEEHKARVSEQTKVLWQTTDIGDKLAQGRRDHWSNAENVAAAAEKTRKQMQDPAVKENLRQAAKARWQDPAYRARMAEKARAQMAARMRDPAYLTKIAAGRKKKSDGSA